MTTIPNPAQWPMYQGNAQRSGGTRAAVLPTAFAQAFTPLSLATAPNGSPAIDAGGLIYVCDGSSSGTVSCISPTGSLNWSADAGIQITSNGPLIGPDGTLYVAGSSLVAFTPQASAATQRFSHALGANLLCSGPLALSADGASLYVAVANASSGTGAILALTLPTSAGAQPTQAWLATLGGQVASGIALAADGTLYAGGTNGQLYSVTAAGAATVAAIGAAGCTVATPALGVDGTVHYLCLDPQQFKTALYAYQPSLPTVRQSFTPTSSSLTIPNGPGAAPAIAPDGSIYVSIDRIYKLAWSTSGGYVQAWKGDPSTDNGAAPGAPVIDSAGSVAIFGSDGWLVSYGAAGALAWKQAFSAANPYLALTAAGAVVFLQGSNVTATQFGGNALLNGLNTALKAAATPASGGKYTYPLTTSTIADSRIYALVTGALGAPGNQSITGSLVYTGLALTLTGATLWLPVAGAPGPVAVTGTLTFTADDTLITLGTSMAAGATFNLGQAIPALAGAFWGQQNLGGFTFTQTASTTQPATGWNASADVALNGALAVAASLFASPPATITVSGPVSVDGAGNPTVALTASATFTLGGAWTLPPITLSLLANTDLDEGMTVSVIQLSTQITVAGNLASLYAAVPANSGTVTLGGQFDPALGASSLGDLISWLSPGLASGLATALPTGFGASGFGVSQISATLSPSTLKVDSASVLFTAPTFTVFSVSSPGVSLSLTGVQAFVTVFAPLGGNPSYSVGISGQIVLDVNSNPVLTVDAEVTGPDWEISGMIAPGGSGVSPANAIAALGGSTTLPTGTPGSSFGYVKFAAQPQFGIYSVGFIGTDTWTLFSIGGFTATFGNFSLLVDRTIADPATNTGLITVSIQGVLTLAGTSIGLLGYVDNQGNWQFGAVLGSALELPSIGQLVGAISTTLAGYLPTAIADLGSNIFIREMSLALGSSGANSLSLDVGSGPGWGGWTILTAPFNLALSEADAKITLDSSATPAASALIAGTFLIGTGGAGLRVQVPLPFSSAQFTLTLVSHPGGVPVPTVGELVGYFSQSLANSLPSAISGLGDNISVTQFSVALQTQPTSQTVVALQLGATDPAAQWSPLGLSNLTLSALGLGGTITFATATTTQIVVTGTLGIGSAAIPLKATATDFSSFTLSLNGGPTQSPTVGDFISVASTTWEQALPSAITSLGSGLDLQTLTLTKTSSSASAVIQVGATFSWTPISGFPVSFTGFTLNCSYASAAGWSGSIAASLSLFGQPGQISASMPTPTFQGTVNMGSNFNMQTVCQSFLGSAAPTWLQAIGIQNLVATLGLASPYKASIGVTLDANIDIGFLGSLQNVVVSANFGGGEAASVCLSATWCPPGGAQIPGNFCYPFDQFKLPGDQDIDVPDDPPDDPPSPDPISSSSASGIAAALGAGLGATVLSTFMSFVLGGGSSRQNQQDADSTCAQGALMHFGANPTTAQLIQVVQALMQTFPSDDTTALAQALYQGGAAVTPTPVTLSDSQIAAALVGAMGAATTPYLAGSALLQLWPTETPQQMVAALDGAGYLAASIGPALPSLYSSGANACTTASTVYAALATGSFTSADLMTALYDCGFSATACVPLFTSIATASAMSLLLATAGFSPLNAALALSAQYPADVANPGAMVAVLTAQGAYGALPSSSLWPCLYSVGYPVSSVLTQMKAGYPSQYATANPLAADAIATGYNSLQIAGPLASLYSLSAQALADALLAAIPTLTSGALMTDLNVAQFSAIVAAAAFVAEAPAHWSSENNADGLAKALVTGGYTALGILNAEKNQFNANIATALLACQVLFTAGIVQSQAQSALLAYGFAPTAVTAAVKQVYG